jgi:4-hydroxyacetophenone monooxygenase
MQEQNGKNGQSDARHLADAIAMANVPTLLMVLVQMTGDLRWLEDKYRTRRARGMNDNDSGGHPEEIQAEVRTAALEAIMAWRAGHPIAIPAPSREMRLKMLSWAMGEDVEEEYDPIIAAELSLEPNDAPVNVPVPEGFEVLIIGAGVSGLCAAIKLQQAGIPFTILEKSAKLGGIWRDNRYPGAGVDTPNHLYSFLNAPYDWSMYYALRDELHAYLDHVADKF